MTQRDLNILKQTVREALPNLSTGTQNALDNEGILFMFQLISPFQNDLKTIHRIGKKSEEELTQRINGVGLKVGEFSEHVFYKSKEIGTFQRALWDKMEEFRKLGPNQLIKSRRGEFSPIMLDDISEGKRAKWLEELVPALDMSAIDSFVNDIKLKEAKEKLERNFSEFVSNGSNKEVLAQILAERIASSPRLEGIDRIAKDDFVIAVAEILQNNPKIVDRAAQKTMKRITKRSGPGES